MQYHIQLNKEIIEHARYALLPGDPGRVSVIANLLERSKPLAVSREFTSWLGYLNQTPVLVVSHGIGGPSTAICVEELARIGVRNFIRIGTSGGMQTDVKPGDVVIANAAIRQDGTSREYLPIEYPAISNFFITAALKRAADELNLPNHVGVVQCKDSFYGQHAPESMPTKDVLLSNWAAWRRCGALASEMETSALFSVAIARKLRAGAVMLCIWNQERDAAGFNHEECFDTDRPIRVAIAAIRHLIQEDGN